MRTRPRGHGELIAKWTSGVSPRSLCQGFVHNPSQEVVKQREGCCLFELDSEMALAFAENTDNFRFSVGMFRKVSLVERPNCHVPFDVVLGDLPKVSEAMKYKVPQDHVWRFCRASLIHVFGAWGKEPRVALGP